MDVLAAYKSANDLTVQLITLATGILALSITFMRDVIKSNSPTWALKGAWLMLLLSVIFGIWMIMAITGSVFRVTTHPEDFKTVSSYLDSIQTPSMLQIVAFVTGIILLIFYGVRSMGSTKKKRKSPRAMWFSRFRKAK
jgi:hypothetical protein